MAPNTLQMRWLAVIVTVVVLGGLIYSNSIEAQAGLVVLVGVLGGVGMYERRQRIQAERE